MADDTKNTLRYTKFDFESHKDAIIQRIRSRWPLVWNDFLANSLGMVFIDIIAWSTSTLAFILNRQAAENYVSTMTLRESAVRLGSLVGYQLRNAVPATVYCEASIPSPVNYDITLKEGTLIRSSDTSENTFELLKDYTIYAGDTTPVQEIARISSQLTGSNNIQSDVVVVAGESYADVIDSTVDLKARFEVGQIFQPLDGGSVYAIQGIAAAPGAVSNNRILLDRGWEGSTSIIKARVYDPRISIVEGQTVSDRFPSPAVETQNYSVLLTRTPVITSSVQVTVNGVEWDAVTALAVGDSAATVFEVQNTSTGKATVVFGDGVFGALIPTEATVIATYRIGGGTQGNVPLGAIKTSVTGIVQSPNDPVSVSISNVSTMGRGGIDAETLEEARVNIPLYTRTNDRAVTLEDYRVIAQSFSHPALGRVKYARATVRIQNALLEGNIVVIYAWTTGSSGGLVPLDAGLKSLLKDFMQSKAVGTDLVQIADGEARPMPLALRFKSSEGFDVTSTVNLVTDTVNEIVNSLTPGETLIYSDFVRSIDSVYGVNSVAFAHPVRDLQPDTPNEIFTSPSGTFEYDIPMSVVTGTKYVGQSRVFPLSAWSLSAQINGTEHTVIADVEAGYARILGASIVPYIYGTVEEFSATPPASVSEGTYFYVKDISSLYRRTGSNWVAQSDPNAVGFSRIDLRTGAVEVSSTGIIGSMSIKINPIQGYNKDRFVNIYVGYKANSDSQSKRREIRGAVRDALEGIGISGTLFAKRIAGLDASTFNITDIVMRIDGVTEVTRVAIETPSNAADRLEANDFELIRPQGIILNNYLD